MGTAISEYIDDQKDYSLKIQCHGLSATDSLTFSKLEFPFLLTTLIQDSVYPLSNKLDMANAYALLADTINFGACQQSMQTVRRITQNLKCSMGKRKVQAFMHAY